MMMFLIEKALDGANLYQISNHYKVFLIFIVLFNQHVILFSLESLWRYW